MSDFLTSVVKGRVRGLPAHPPHQGCKTARCTRLQQGPGHLSGPARSLYRRYLGDDPDAHNRHRRAQSAQGRCLRRRIVQPYSRPGSLHRKGPPRPMRSPQPADDNENDYYWTVLLEGIPEDIEYLDRGSKTQVADPRLNGARQRLCACVPQRHAPARLRLRRRADHRRHRPRPPPPPPRQSPLTAAET